MFLILAHCIVNGALKYIDVYCPPPPEGGYGTKLL